MDTKLNVWICGQQPPELHKEKCFWQAEESDPPPLFRTCEILLEYSSQAWFCQFKTWTGDSPMKDHKDNNLCWSLSRDWSTCIMRRGWNNWICSAWRQKVSRGILLVYKYLLGERTALIHEDHHMAVNTETKIKKKTDVNLCKITLGLGDICCKKENTLRQANFYQHEEIQKNMQYKLIWFLLIAVLLSLFCFFKHVSQHKWRSPALELGSALSIMHLSFTNESNWFSCKT